MKVTSKDISTLLQGLPQLSNLSKVSVTGGSQYLYERPNPAYSYAHAAVAAFYLCKSIYEAWDRQFVQHLFEALASVTSYITELHIGNWQDDSIIRRVGLPLRSFVAPNATDQARFITNAQSVFSHLTDLSLQIDLKFGSRGPDYNDSHFESLFKILSSTTQLKRLAFGVTQLESALDVHNTRRLLSNTWPSLVEITLQCMRVDPETLLDFFARHKDTLNILSLRQVGFEQNTPHTWLDVAQRAARLLHLELVELDVFEWGNYSDIRGRRFNKNERDIAVILGRGNEARSTTCMSSQEPKSKKG